MGSHLRLIAGAVAALLVLSSGQSASAASGLLVKVSAYSGTATFSEDLNPKSDTPIFFSDEITWSLPGAVQRRVAVGQTARVPVRIRVHGTVHGVYAILGPMGEATSYVPYDCTALWVGVQAAQLRLTRATNGVRRLTVELMRPETLHNGVLRCTDKEQGETVYFPSGSPWLASHLVSREPVARLGVQIERGTSRPTIRHVCGTQAPVCVERLKFTSRLRFVAQQ
jgi:hypothetical protein